MVGRGGANNFCLTAASAPALPGSYALAIDLCRRLSVRMAATTETLAPGRYVYCGSAHGPGGLRARLMRHIRREKSVHWHVDQLTKVGAIRGAWVFPGGSECELVAMLAHLPAPLAGFGSSDCDTCRSHLLYWPDHVPLPDCFEV